MKNRIRFWIESYTFLMLPENGKAVIRFRIPRIVLILLPIIFAFLIGAIYMLNQLHNHNLATLNALESRLHLKESELENTIYSKNQMIDKLQNDIMHLAEQADEVQLKIDELKQLETELRSLTVNPAKDNKSGSTLAEEQAKPVQIASFAANRSSMQNMGGPWVNANEANYSEVVFTTELSYTGLQLEMEALYSSLIDAKEEVLAYQADQRLTPTIWPTDSRRITSEFGYRRDPFTRRTSLHTGIDIGGKTGEAVYATADGVITSVGYDRAAGNHIMIHHKNGLQTQYMHLSKTLVSKGQKVEKGELIGQIGSTGRSTGAHLHYEVIVNGKAVNPKPYMITSREDETN